MIFDFLKRKPKPRPTCGGHERHWDKSAPSVINSKRPIEFETMFYHYNQTLPSGTEKLEFSIREEDGKWFLSGPDNLRTETDETLLARVQEVIDRNHLTGYNGHSEITYGVPPEYQPYWMKVKYDSGEQLYFSLQFNPGVRWGAELRRLFCAEYDAHGIEDLLPPAEMRNIVRFDMEFNEWPLHYTYGVIRMQDDVEGERPVHYMKAVWDREKDETVTDEIIKVPEGFYEHITAMVRKAQLWDYVNGKIDFPSFDFKGAVVGKTKDSEGTYVEKNRLPVLHFCAQSEQGRQFNLFVYGDDVTEELRELVEPFREYVELVFAATEEKTSLSKRRRG